MSKPEIIDLADYRRLRERRRRETFALYGADGERSRLVLQLWRAVSVVDGDRAAAVWIDEYGPGLVHVYCILDLAADPARRSFTADPLKRAWDTGVPGLLDLPDVDRVPELAVPEGVRSLSAVSLGSDGVKAWFLVVDSMTPRSALADPARGELMFSAGEAAGLLLHRDLGALTGDGAVSEGHVDGARLEEGGFAGWRVLQDFGEDEEDEELNRRITRRFLVVRLVRALADDDFVIDPGDLERRVDAVRTELAGSVGDEDGEIGVARRVVDAVEAGDPEGIGREAIALADVVESSSGHYHGAGELYELAYEAAVAASDRGLAIDAARFYARSRRKLGDGEEAEAWYLRAEEMADATGDLPRKAIVMVGRATVVRNRGRLPEARELLDEALAVAEGSGDAYAGALAHHALSNLAFDAGDRVEAIVHAWRAVELYPERAQRNSALLQLAGAFVESEHFEAAEDAYAVALHETEGELYRVYGLSGLAFAAAMLGKEEEFDRRSAELDAVGWEETAPHVKTQVLYEQGRGRLAFGRIDEARERLEAALELAEEEGLNKLLFDIEEALDAVDAEEWPREVPAPAEAPEPVAEVFGDLRSMRGALVGS